MSTLHASQDLINLIKQINLDINYPIGSIYLSFDKNSPGSRLGGTWQLCGSGRYLMCYDPNNAWFDKPGSDRGTSSGPGSWNSNNTVLTINQIPSHNHGSSNFSGRTPNIFTGAQSEGSNGIVSWHKYSNRQYTTNGTASNSWMYYKFSHSHTHSNNGGGQGHNHFHVSPYMTVCVWQRIA